MPDNVEPALKPNQPNARMNVPIATIERLWPGITLGLPFLSNLPMRGPSCHAPTSAITPPVMCTTELPAKSTCPCPSPKLAPSCDSQPPPHVQLPKIG